MDRRRSRRQRSRFLGRVWRLVMSVSERSRPRSDTPMQSVESVAGEVGRRRSGQLRRKTHDTIRRVSSDIDPRVHLNTAISALMELVNELYRVS